MSVSNILALFGGVALFLFGMSLMGDGLKKVAGSSLELVLFRLSGTPLRGMLLGTGVTAVIQSSAATSIMVVGFVNSGMMKLRQAISVILGALVGTSITGWIIALSSLESSSGGLASVFSTATISAAAAIVGIVLRMFSRQQQKRHIGDILLGFAVLMFGMQSMSGAVSPLRQSETFINILTTFSNPLLGILVGAVFTAILQSASAAIGILQALSATGAVTFATAYPIILGIAVGAAVPVLLSAIGARVDGRRAAFSYLISELSGAVVCAIAFYSLDFFMDFAIKQHVMNAFSIALVNTVFRTITALVLMPLVDRLAALISAIVKESEAEREVNREFDRLDERFLKHPAVAVEQSRLTVNSMANVARTNLFNAMSLLAEYDASGYDKVQRAEDLLDQFEDKLGTYLVKLTVPELTSAQNEHVSKYLHTLSDFERIGDHAVNIAETALEKHEKKVSFSPQAQQELAVLSGAVSEIVNVAVDCFVDENLSAAYRVEPLEERIDVLCDEMKLRHVDRLQKGECSLNDGFIFNDLLTNFERVADHASNIAIAQIELHTQVYDAHSYVINLKELHSHNFDEYYGEYSEKYRI